MGAEAGYIIIEYIKTKVNEIIDPDTLVMYPGKFSASSADVSSGTYLIVPNIDIGMYYVNADAITITIYHQTFDILQDILSILLNTLNVEHARDNAQLYAAGIAENIRYLSISASVSRTDHNNFLEGTEYFVASIDILVKYVNLATGANFRSRQNNVSAYVSA